MMDSIVSLPFVWAFLILFVVVMLRSNATYWAGRGLAAGGRRTKLQKHLDSPASLRAEKVIARWGAPAVSVSFLTVGVQTAINMSAGLCRMPLRRYIPATVVGSIAWAGIYATIGLAAFDAALTASHAPASSTKAPWRNAPSWEWKFPAPQPPRPGLPRNIPKPRPGGGCPRPAAVSRGRPGWR